MYAGNYNGKKNPSWAQRSNLWFYVVKLSAVLCLSINKCNESLTIICRMLIVGALALLLSGKTAHHHSRVARWFIFKPKIPIWINFGGPKIGKCWYILWPSGIFDGHLGYFMTICYILCSFGIFFWFRYHVPRKSGNHAS
jgi:hypothetical protein